MHLLAYSLADTALSVLNEDLPTSGTLEVEWARAGHISWQVEEAVVGSESLPSDGPNRYLDVNDVVSSLIWCARRSMK